MGYVSSQEGIFGAEIGQPLLVSVSVNLIKPYAIKSFNLDLFNQKADNLDLLFFGDFF